MMLSVAEQLKSECPFCPTHDRAVLESHSLAIAIADGFPLSQGHSLIVPRRHVASWFDLSNEEHGPIVELLGQLRRRLDATYEPDGYNIGINDCPAAGQP